MLSRLLEATSGLIEVSLELAPPLLRILQRLLNTGHLAPDRVKLLLCVIERIGGLGLR